MGVSRKSFLLGAAALAGLVGCRTSAVLRRRRIALNASTIRTYGLTLKEQVEAAVQAGFAGFEPWLKDVHEAKAKGCLGEIAELAREGDLAFVNGISFAPWAHADPGIRAVGLEELRRDMAALAEMGCPYVAASLFGMHKPGAKRLSALEIAERYAPVCELGDRMGVKPLLEYWGHSVNMCRLEDALAALKLVNRDDTAVLADVYHTYRGGGDFAAFSRLRSGMLPVLHVNDYPADRPRGQLTDADRIWPGEGGAPWKALAAHLRSAGLEPWLSLELFNPSYCQTTPQMTLREAKRRMDRLEGMIS